MPSEVCAHRVMATTGVNPSELLDGDRVLQRRPPGAPHRLGKWDPHPAKLAHLGHQLIREALLVVERLGHRGHLGSGEVPHRALKQPRVVVELEVHDRGAAYRRG